MSYVPPHLRKSKETNDNKSNKEKDLKKELKKQFKEEFPALAPVPEQKKVNMDFKELFARRREVRKRLKKMKYGWIKLTSIGIVDSLTPEQREKHDYDRNNQKMEDAMYKIACRIECQTERRMEYEDLEPVILEDYSSLEEYSSSEESYVDEDEEYDEN
jgi:hypothetical protein